MMSVVHDCMENIIFFEIKALDIINYFPQISLMNRALATVRYIESGAY